MEQERNAAKEEAGIVEQVATETSRVRADSVLQDEQVPEEDLREKGGIETMPQIPVDFMIDGIREAERSEC
jgi:hypothetical protein